MRKDLLNTVKGMRDFSPSDMILRKKILNTIEKYFKSFGFLPLETPTLEYYKLLMDKYGEEGDKLIYSFEDKAGRKLGMIYDLTVPLSRYVAANYNNIVFPFKRYQIQRVYRYDNPQHGRYREFYQCDIDTIGSNSPYVEAELLAVASKILKEFSLNFKIKLNFRTFLDQFLEENGIKRLDEKELFMKAIDKLDKIPEEKVIVYLKENNFSIPPKELIEKLKNTQNIPNRFNEIAELYAKFCNRENIEFSPLLARGLSYYTDSIFEIVLVDENIGSIAGGGRYDNLLGNLIDKDIPACGLALGFERIFNILKAREEVENFYDFFIINNGFNREELELLNLLAEKGKRCFYYPEHDKFKKQLKKAINLKAKFLIILGENELKNGTISIKNLETKTQETIEYNDFIRSVK